MTGMAKIRELVRATSGRSATQSTKILQLCLEAIVKNPHHLTRAHLYGLLVNYMQYTRELAAPGLALAGDRYY